jgi:integrase
VRAEQAYARVESLAPKPVTLVKVLARYLVELKYASDGSLKTVRYRRECKKRAKYLLTWFQQHFGPGFQAARVTMAHAKDYARARREGEVNSRTVRTRTVQADVAFLKAALNWAANFEVDSQPLISRNPLANLRTPREQDPRRPLIDAETVAALLRVAPRVHPLMHLLITLVKSTGRRLSSVLGLRWDDFDFENRIIRWRPELDKRRRTWVTAMPTRAAEELLAHRTAHPVIGNALVFPASRKPDLNVSRHLAADWLKRAYRYAELEKPAGGLWHCFRRKWATERKHHPIRDVAYAGGWSDTQTLLTCYTHPDLDTMREVVDHPKLTQKLTHWGKLPKNQKRDTR